MRIDFVAVPHFAGAATQQEATVLHTHGGVPGSRRLLPRAVLEVRIFLCS